MEDQNPKPINKKIKDAAILLLVREKKLKLSDYITQIIDLEGTEVSPNVTVEQLLNHTSGIHDDAEEEAGEQYSELFATSPNYAFKECRDFLKNFVHKKPNFEPGPDVRYCNCSYVLLGPAIDKITGKSYREYVTENVFRKAGMRNTAFLSMDYPKEDISVTILSNQDCDVWDMTKQIQTEIYNLTIP